MNLQRYSKPEETNCPNCGAPWNTRTRRCDYCRTHMPVMLSDYDWPIYSGGVVTTTTGSRLPIMASGVYFPYEPPPPKEEPYKPKKGWSIW